MAGSLAQAEVIGGAVVQITGDLSGLRAAHVDAKRIAATATNDLKITATVNTALVKAGLDAMKRQVEQAVADANRAMSRLGNLGIGSGSGLDFKGRSGGGSEIAAEQAANRRKWQEDGRAFVQFLRDQQNERIKLAREAGEKEGEAYLEGQQRIFNRYRNSGGGGGSGGGSGGGGRRGGRIKGLDDALENFLPGGFNAAFKIGGALAIARAGGAIINSAADVAELGPRAGIESAVMSADSTIGGAGGGINRLQRAIFGKSIGDKIVEATNWWGLTNTETFSERQAFDKKEALRAQRMARATAGGAASAAANQTIRAIQADAIGGAEGQAASALGAFNEQVGAFESPAITRARTMLQGRVKAGRAADQERLEVAFDRDRAARFQIQAMQTFRRGDGDQAFYLGQYAARVGLQAGQRERLAGVTDPKQRALITQQNATETKLFDEQQYEEQLDRALQKKQQFDAKVGAENDAQLRLQKRGYEADLAAFDRAAQAKIETIKDTNEKALASAIYAAQRSVLVAEQQQQIKATRMALGAAADVAGLRADNRNQEADVAAFDAETQQGLMNVDSANRQDYINSRQRQRDALIKRQRRENESFGRGIGTRIGSAEARGRGQSALAGIIGQLAGMNEEYEGTDPNRRGQVIKAQRAELLGLEQEMNRPRTYLRGFDPLREAVGDPLSGGGRAGEAVAVLKKIEDYLKTLAAREGGLPN